MTAAAAAAADNNNVHAQRNRKEYKGEANPHSDGGDGAERNCSDDGSIRGVAQDEEDGEGQNERLQGIAEGPQLHSEDRPARREGKSGVDVRSGQPYPIAGALPPHAPAPAPAAALCRSPSRPVHSTRGTCCGSIQQQRCTEEEQSRRQHHRKRGGHVGSPQPLASHLGGGDTPTPAPVHVPAADLLPTAVLHSCTAAAHNTKSRRKALAQSVAIRLLRCVDSAHPEPMSV
mmetsp:Transcript_9558/g.23590  ORF Transcript_9558/g.23590 Transcript_9558/m.23590 type:complete len:231 (-) Transcript_9558:1426-2118(-)